MNTTISDQANNGQASLPSKRWKALAFPPGMTWEARQAHIEQYLKDRALADLTAKNTRSNKEDKKLADFTAKNRKSKKKIKCRSTSLPYRRHPCIHVNQRT